MEILKKIASYVWDIPIKHYSSLYNPTLTVAWSEGKKVLHSQNANYSFGSLHLVFLEACSKLNQEIEQAKSILILGFGAGSILHILENNHLYKGRVVGVDYDPLIFEIFREHFAQGINLKPELIESDAKEYLSHTNDKFDIIFIDLFQDLETDSLLFSKELPELLKNHLQSEGVVAINTISQSANHKQAIFDLIINLGKCFKSVSTLDCQDINKLIFAK